MKERPIPFSGPMVRAILVGIKSQTRRVIRNPEKYTNIRECDFCCPCGVVGDRLWVREGWRTYRKYDDMPPRDLLPIVPIQYEVDGVARNWPKHPTSPLGRYRHARFMPRWASRIDLEITEVRVERLHDIGRDGRKAQAVLAEGIPRRAIDREREWFHPDDAPAIAFSRLWDSINGKRAPWESNPLVWAISFKRIKPAAS